MGTLGIQIRRHNLKIAGNRAASNFYITSNKGLLAGQIADPMVLAHIPC